MDTTAPSATPACPTRPPGSPPDAAYQITASDYSAIDGDVLLGDDFPSEWCMLAAVNCASSEGGTLMYYEDSNGLGYRMDISDGRITFDMRSATYSLSEQLCDNSWNQFSVCFDGGALVYTKDCTNARLMGRPADPELSTTTGSLTIFTNGSSSDEFSVSCNSYQSIDVTVELLHRETPKSCRSFQFLILQPSAMP